MKSIAESAMVDLPEPNLSLLATTASKSVYSPSDITLQLTMDSNHNQLVKGEDGEPR